MKRLVSGLEPNRTLTLRALEKSALLALEAGRGVSVSSLAPVVGFKVIETF